MTVKELKNYLHSNMVRFIIQTVYLNRELKIDIYIPIWLDLLFFHSACDMKK